MWGLASPPRPQGRTESCTLRILADALSGAHGYGGGTLSVLENACRRRGTLLNNGG